MKRLNGIHLRHLKNTQDMKTVKLPLPDRVTILMSQNMGAECSPLVAIGEKVTVGQKIGDSSAFMSAPVHSSVSGTVVAIKEHLLANGGTCQALVIEADGKQTVSAEVVPPVINDKESLVAAVRQSGACGLGGAGFPTHIKLNFDEKTTPIDTLIINGAECEPYITADYRELMENPADVIGGARMLMNFLKIPKTKICIESNKPAAIEKLKKMTTSIPEIEIVPLPSKYPQGAEKVIIYSATGRIVKEGELPSAQGVIVMNVSTTAFIFRYSKTGMPLVSKRLTVDGDAVKKPCSVEVPIGTPISEVLSFAKAQDYEKILAGGPMMGLCIYDTSAPIVKTNNAILAFKKAKLPSPTACIRCGRCIKACPLDLMPEALEKAFDRRDLAALKELKVQLCMNCGCCTYVCPAKRPLAEKNQLAKLEVRN